MWQNNCLHQRIKDYYSPVHEHLYVTCETPRRPENVLNAATSGLIETTCMVMITTSQSIWRVWNCTFLPALEHGALTPPYPVLDEISLYISNPINTYNLLEVNTCFEGDGWPLRIRMLYSRLHGMIRASSSIPVLNTEEVFPPDSLFTGYPNYPCLHWACNKFS